MEGRSVEVVVWRRRRHEVKINDASFAEALESGCTAADLCMILIGLERSLMPGLARDDLTLHCCLSSEFRPQSHQYLDTSNNMAAL